jgi:hypothetical protein
MIDTFEQPKKANPFRREELLILRDMAGKFTVEEIRDKINEECGTKRKRQAIKNMATKYGYSLNFKK